MKLLGLGVPILCAAGSLDSYSLAVSARPELIVEAQVVKGSRAARRKRRANSDLIVEFRITNAGAEPSAVGVFLNGSILPGLESWAPDSIRQYPHCASHVKFDPPPDGTPQGGMKVAIRCAASILPRFARRPIPKDPTDKVPPSATIIVTIIPANLKPGDQFEVR